ncbi:hypothetical protein HK101_009166 [Irineochytrium annulatum]|nr:hypothetical protein HK101_009166 [Irineochytrium annulatum]
MLTHRLRLLLLLTFGAAAVIADNQVGDEIDLGDLQGSWTVEEHQPRQLHMQLQPTVGGEGDENQFGPDGGTDLVRRMLFSGHIPRMVARAEERQEQESASAASSVAAAHPTARPPSRHPPSDAGPGTDMSALACDANTDVTWDINGPIWKRYSSVPDSFNSNGRYYVLQAVKGDEMNFIKFRVFANLVDEIQPCIGYLRDGNRLRIMINATNANTCPDKYDEFAGVCKRWVFWVGTCSSGPCLTGGAGGGGATAGGGGGSSGDQPQTGASGRAWSGSTTTSASSAERFVASALSAFVLAASVFFLLCKA